MKRSTIVLIIFIVTAVFISGCGLAYAPVASLLKSDGRAVQLQADPTMTPAAVQEVQNAPETQTGSSIRDFQATFEQIYELVNPSVVNIQVGSSAAAALSQGIPGGLGSGFVWDDEGHIVTNSHVVNGAGQILVTFADGTTVEAELVGEDPNSDLAVIKVDSSAVEDLRPVTVADSSLVKVGQLAIAIGNPFGLSGTMTEGIVSARARSLPVGDGTVSGGSYTIPDIIQTDAAINPGNSGGVLVDIEGHVIGVTAAIRSTIPNANSGIGFVIPSNIVKRVVPTLIDEGAYEHPRMGVSGRSLSYEVNQVLGLDAGLKGVVVMEVVPNSPAERAGLQGATGQGRAGDIIIAIDEQPVRSFEDLTTYLFYNTEVGQEVTLTILRQGEEQEVQLTLGSITQ